MVKLIQYLKEKYKGDVILYFTARFPEHKALYIQLTSQDVLILFKQGYRVNNRLKANCDVEIAHRITYDIENNNVNKIILVSGDGDFVSLLDYAREKIESVRCFCVHPRNTSTMIKERLYLEVTYMFDIIDLLQKREIPDTDLPV